MKISGAQERKDVERCHSRIEGLLHGKSVGNLLASNKYLIGAQYLAKHFNSHRTFLR